MGLFTNASLEDQKTILITIPEENFQVNGLQLPRPVKKKKLKLLHSIDILSKIVNEFLTIHEILILRKTCLAFKILLLPNDQNMVMFCKDFDNLFCKQIDNDIPLTWFDLKYFLNQSYTNALEKMELLKLKHNQYAVFTRDKKIISWYNEQTPSFYDQLIINKIKNGIYQIPQNHTQTQRCLIAHTNYLMLHYGV
jgi:hypothetical protein